MSFKDHFSQHAGLYAQARPGYPDELFQYLASLTPGKHLVWDCGTGNGQAAVSLAKYFRQVHATDASAEQVKNAKPHPQVQYAVSPSEQCSLPDHSADLVTAAAAVHWFDHEKFYAEVKRVLKPRGIIAVWTYTHTQVDERVDPVARKLEWDMLGDYWPKETRFVMDRYTTLPFPFGELPAPAFKSVTEWDLHQLCAYFRSWSAAQRYLKAHGTDPVADIFTELQKAWGDAAKKKKVSWELAMKVGRVN